MDNNFTNNHKLTKNTLKFGITGKTSEGKEIKEVIEAPSQLAAEIQFKEKYGEDTEIKFEILMPTF